MKANISFTSCSSGGTKPSVEVNSFVEGITIVESSIFNDRSDLVFLAVGVGGTISSSSKSSLFCLAPITESS